MYGLLKMFENAWPGERRGSMSEEEETLWTLGEWFRDMADPWRINRGRMASWLSVILSNKRWLQAELSQAVLSAPKRKIIVCKSGKWLEKCSRGARCHSYRLVPTISRANRGNGEVRVDEALWSMRESRRAPRRRRADYQLISS